MSQQPASFGWQNWQFNLKDLLIAVAFLGLACAAGKFAVNSFPREGPPDNLGLMILSLLSIPISLGGCIGTLCGRLGRWMIYGIVLDLLIICLSIVCTPGVQ